IDTTTDMALPAGEISPVGNVGHSPIAATYFRRYGAASVRDASMKRRPDQSIGRVPLRRHRHGDEVSQGLPAVIGERTTLERVPPRRTGRQDNGAMRRRVPA